jgi:hypothetical protein
MMIKPVVLLTLALAVSLSAGMMHPAEGVAFPGGGNTDQPFPVDMGNMPGNPSTYKGLPLGLRDTGEPVVTPVDGLIGVVCIGMSNGSMECTDFINRLQGGLLPGPINAQVRVVNCAVGSHAIERWNDPAYDAVLWDACIDVKIPAGGLRPDQVRVVWHKAASQFTTDPAGNVLPPYPDPASDYFRFYNSLGVFAQRLQAKLPSVQAVYTSSRSYGGFSTRPPRGEPLSFEEGMALNQWLADYPAAHGVWHGWGGYIWAPDCASGIVNGVCYVRYDFQEDGIHPSASGRAKVSLMLDRRFRQHGWYAPAVACDVNGDAAVDIADVQAVAGAFNQTVPPAPAAYDLHPDGLIDLQDVVLAAQCWLARGAGAGQKSGAN